jgi:tetratricopeptide (TPR) repeat protein
LEAATKGCLAHNHFTEALDFINLQLARTPADPHWLFGKGYALVQLKSYPQAAAAFTGVLAVETNNFNALFNRAIAYLNDQQFSLARTDYLRLQQTFTNAYPVAFGLSEIAQHQHDTNEVIRNYQIYLANAPTNTAEFVSVRKRLADLRGQ